MACPSENATHTPATVLNSFRQVKAEAPLQEEGLEGVLASDRGDALVASHQIDGNSTESPGPHAVTFSFCHFLASWTMIISKNTSAR